MRSIALAVSALAFSIPVTAQQVPGCGSVRELGHESDYRTANPAVKNQVEGFHFTPEVEMLLRGKSGHLGEDLAFTLRWFPNHHRALVAISRYAERLKVDQVPHASYSVDCYFRRATAFTPDDQVARLLYAGYLFKAKRNADANREIDRAAELARDNPFTHYNIGLVLVEHQQYERALFHAHRAAALGFPRQELKERLVAARQWREPVANAPASAASQAPAATSAPADPAQPKNPG